MTLANLLSDLVRLRRDAARIDQIIERGSVPSADQIAALTSRLGGTRESGRAKPALVAEPA